MSKKIFLKISRNHEKISKKSVKNTHFFTKNVCKNPSKLHPFFHEKYVKKSVKITTSISRKKDGKNTSKLQYQFH